MLPLAGDFRLNSAIIPPVTELSIAFLKECVAELNKGCSSKNEVENCAFKLATSFNFCAFIVSKIFIEFLLIG